MQTGQRTSLKLSPEASAVVQELWRERGYRGWGKASDLIVWWSRLPIHERAAVDRLAGELYAGRSCSTTLAAAQDQAEALVAKNQERADWPLRVSRDDDRVQTLPAPPIMDRARPARAWWIIPCSKQHPTARLANVLAYIFDYLRASPLEWLEDYAFYLARRGGEAEDDQEGACL